MLWNRNDFNAVPVPALEKFRFRLRFGIQTICSTVFHRKKIVQNLAISMLGSSTVPMKLASHLVIVTFVFHFMLDLDLNPVPECIPVLESWNNLWVWKPSKHRVVVPARYPM